ncbi:MAG: hypothetical protein IT293_07780 [Deltaproteobacteria bacterium]|nr:hypothetical protein [Deltaproteobacteria bacterium]
MNAAPDVDADEGGLEHRARLDLPYSARSFDRWLRARLVEHWAGDRCWREIDRGDFGVLRRAIHPDRFLVADIVARLLTGGENLTIIAWALEAERNLDDVVAILTVLDLNAHRVTRFAWLPPATPVVPHLRLARSS